MAIKTVIANELSDWGILSVQWQQARRADQGIVKDIDVDVEYLDTEMGADRSIEDRKPEPTGLQQATTTTPITTKPKSAKSAGSKPAEPPKTSQDAPGGVHTPPEPSKAQEQGKASDGAPTEATAVPSAEPQTTDNPPGEGEATDEQAEAEAGLAPLPEFKPRSGESDALTGVRRLLHEARTSEDELMVVLRKNKVAKLDQRLSELSDAKLLNIGRAFPSLNTQIKAMKEEASPSAPAA